jgi:hypothetical protein
VISELSRQEERKLDLGLALLRQDGAPSERAELATRLLGFRAQQHAWDLLLEHQGGSLDHEESDLHWDDLVDDPTFKFEPRKDGWLCGVQVRIPALPWAPRYAGKEFQISQELWDLGFFLEGEGGQDRQAVEVRWQLDPDGAGSVMRLSAALRTPQILRERSSWLPRSLDCSLPDGGEFWIRTIKKDPRNRVLHLWPPHVEWDGGLVCRGSRSWHVPASDQKVRMVLEAAESPNCTSSSLGVLISRLGFQEREANATLKEKDPHYGQAYQALTGLLRQLARFQPWGEEGRWRWDWLGGETRSWEPTRRGRAGRLVAKISEGAIVLRRGPHLEVMYSFTAEGNLLDDRNMASQRERLTRELSEIWGEPVFS